MNTPPAETPPPETPPPEATVERPVERPVDELLDVAIIGGGITGLSTAFFLLQSNPALRIRVFESSAVPGGKVAGDEVAGIAVDTGPDAFLARVPGGVELAEALGLSNELVAPATGQAYVWSRGALRSLPEGLVLGVPTNLRSLARSRIISTRGIARAALDEVIPRRQTMKDPTVSVAIGDHLGREVVERLVDPLLGGINASDSDTLSLASAAPNLSTAAASSRLMRALRASNATTARGQIGITEDRPVFLAPRRGIRTLIEKLQAHVPVSLHSMASKLEHVDGVWRITVTGDVVRAHMVVLATPAGSSALLLAHVAPRTAMELRTIRTASVALTLLAYPAGSVVLPPGSGMLVPRPEQRLLTASSWWNQKWPHLDTHGHVLIRASAGRDGDTRFMDLDDDTLVDALHHDLTDALGLTAKPIDAKVTRWVGGFPQYDAGHAERVNRVDAALEQETKGVVLAGASYRGIGIPACIRDARRATDHVLSVQSALSTSNVGALGPARTVER